MKYLFILLLVLLLIIFCLFMDKKINKRIKKSGYGIDRISKILYINLKHRLDRKKRLESEINKIGYPMKDLIRINAIKHQNGPYGCLLSHILALETAKKLNFEYILILEDDFVWKYNRNVMNKILDNALNVHGWDVCLLSCSLRPWEEKSIPLYKNINKVISCQTASSYIIKKHYISTLLKFWKSYIQTTKGGFFFKAPRDSVDQSWKILQKKDFWISTNPLLGKQGDSWSDIQKRITRYNE